MKSRTQYILRETAVSVVINAALSIAFVFLAFHGKLRIPMLGAHGVVVDMAPQTFMVVLMSCLVPALLTRKRVVNGLLLWNLSLCDMTTKTIFVTALIGAALTAGATVAFCWVVLPLISPGGVAFVKLLLSKAAFGMVLAAVATPWMIRRVLHDPNL